MTVALTSPEVASYCQAGCSHQRAGWGRWPEGLMLMLTVNSIVSELCNHQHYQFWNITITPKRNSVPSSSHFHFCPTSSPSSRQPIIYFTSLWILSILDIFCKWNRNMWPMVTGFFHLAWFFQDSSRLQCVLVLHSLIWMDTTNFVYPLIHWWTFRLFPLWSYYKSCCYGIHMREFARTCIFISLG